MPEGGGGNKNRFLSDFLGEGIRPIGAGLFKLFASTGKSLQKNALLETPSLLSVTRNQCHYFVVCNRTISYFEKHVIYVWWSEVNKD